MTAVSVSDALVDYKNEFHDCVVRGVVAFLDNHRDVLEAGYSNSREVRRLSLIHI